MIQYENLVEDQSFKVEETKAGKIERSDYDAAKARFAAKVDESEDLLLATVHLLLNIGS